MVFNFITIIIIKKNILEREREFTGNKRENFLNLIFSSIISMSFSKNIENI